MPLAGAATTQPDIGRGGRHARVVGDQSGQIGSQQGCAVARRLGVLAGAGLSAPATAHRCGTDHRLDRQRRSPAPRRPSWSMSVGT